MDVPSEIPRPLTEVQRECVEGVFVDLWRDSMLAESKKPPHQKTIDEVFAKATEPRAEDQHGPGLQRRVKEGSHLHIVRA